MTQSKSKASSKKQAEVQRIIDTLSKAIAQHRLKPGQRLVEAQIVGALNVNRNHVQTALQRLSLQRVVTIEPNRGAFVSQPSAQEAREIFAARRSVERGIVEAISIEKIERHWDIINAHMLGELEVTSGTDRQAIVGKLSDYHRLLADICDNTVLKEIFDNLMVRSSLIVSLYQRNDVPTCQHNEHKKVLDALRLGDNDLAVKVMLEHLNNLEAELVLDDNQGLDIDLASALNDI
jgi:DNA-binding GntR family transcriptional regulator